MEKCIAAHTNPGADNPGFMAPGKCTHIAAGAQTTLTISLADFDKFMSRLIEAQR